MGVSLTIPAFDYLVHILTSAAVRHQRLGTALHESRHLGCSTLNQAREILPDAWRRKDLLQACEQLLVELDEKRSNNKPPAFVIARLHHQLNVADKALEGQSEEDCQAIFQHTEVSQIRERLAELMEQLQS
ncbi:hypothetical protein KFU94_01585 [Chloroflexi bacterium TSY]|nr:hypothetical protein [Chloroflexi bacterium TSY]